MLGRQAAYSKLCASFACYRPLYRQRVRRHGRPVYVDRPVLGRYVLVEMITDWISQFFQIKAIRGVYGVLLLNEKPLVVRENEIRRLRDQEIRGYIPRAIKERFKLDQRVVINHGAFTHFEAIFKREKGTLDVVEIELFGSKREILLPMGSVVAV